MSIENRVTGIGRGESELEWNEVDGVKHGAGFMDNIGRNYQVLVTRMM